MEVIPTLLMVWTRRYRNLALMEDAYAGVGIYRHPINQGCGWDGMDSMSGYRVTLALPIITIKGGIRW